jgi:hypothetical protein
MQALGTSAPDPTIPELDLDGMIAALKAAGYSVRKARAATKRSTPTTCQHCGAYAARVVYTHTPRKPKQHRTAHGLCESCYRLGPQQRATPKVPADPIRYARLYRAWRHAQHRYSQTITYGYQGTSYRAHARLVAITKALHAERFVYRERMEAAA